MSLYKLFKSNKLDSSELAFEDLNYDNQFNTNTIVCRKIKFNFELWVCCVVILYLFLNQRYLCLGPLFKIQIVLV